MSVNTLKKLLNETSDKLTPQLFKRCHELRDKFKFIQEKKTRTEQEVALKKYKLDNMAIKIGKIINILSYIKNLNYNGKFSSFKQIDEMHRQGKMREFIEEFTNKYCK